jgi:molybdenum cofactor sulfurtransferase
LTTYFYRSRASEEYVVKARKAVLSFFDAPEEDYVCIFTSNCSTALKLVGESFPFEEGSRFVLAEDSHNSVNGIRRFAEAKGGSVRYVPTTSKGGFVFNDMLVSIQFTQIERTLTLANQSALQEGNGDQQGASLLALTGQSNISGSRPDIPAVLQIAKDLGYATLVDGAALVSTTSISLATTSTKRSYWGMKGNIDALAISFYKMFGYPTGIGALVARKDFLRKLRRPWFAGGTVDTVGLPCGVVESDVPWERFEEGTINYTGLVAIPNGLAMLSRYLTGDTPILPLRLSILHSWLYNVLEGITHPNGQSVVTVLTAAPNSVEPPSTIEWNGSSMEVRSSAPGYTLSAIFHHSNGQQIPISQVSTRASAAGISLRSGCMCNPGGAMGLLGLRHMMDRLAAASEGGSDGNLLTKNDVEQMVGEELGVIRISLGLVSDFRDVWAVARFASTFVESTQNVH